MSGVVDGVKHLLGVGSGDDRGDDRADRPASSAPPGSTPGTPSGGRDPARAPAREKATGAARPSAADPAAARGKTTGAAGTKGTKPIRAGRPARTLATPPPGVDSVEDLEGCTADELNQPGPVVRVDPDPGQPRVARPSRLTGTKVTMVGLSYDGVVDLPAADGAIRALKFSMSRSVTDDFELRIPGPGSKTTSLRSSALKVEGDVHFYASRFHGKLLGIPLTFTPDSPPPLTLPIMVFGDPDIQLVYVECHTLTAPNLDTTIP